MAEYRRFIAYIYEYVNGMKERNVGFAKVESRNGVCRLQVHLQEIGSKEEKLKILGFARNGARIDTMDVGICPIMDGNADFKGSTPSQNFGNSSYTLDQISGMYLEGDGGSTYASAWDDEMIQIEKLRAGTEEHEVHRNDNTLLDQEAESEEEDTGTQAQDTIAEVTAGSSGTMGESGSEKEKQPETDSKNMHSEEVAEADTESGNLAEELYSSDTTALERKNHEENIEASREKEGQSKITEGVQGAELREAELTDMKNPQNICDKGKTKSNESGQGQVRAAQAYAYAQNQPMVKRPMCANKGMMNNGTCLERKWEHFQRQYPGFQPFTDDEIIECIQIVPKDIMYLRRDDWKLGRNNFVMQGFYTHRHLLLGKNATGGYVLGIPGYDENQERFLANMYGFIHFKSARIEGKNDKYGYWLRQVN